MEMMSAINTPPRAYSLYVYVHVCELLTAHKTVKYSKITNMGWSEYRR